MTPPTWAHPPPGQTLGCHWEVTFGKYCKQSETRHEKQWLFKINKVN